MRSSKGGKSTTPSKLNRECCMCGDYGLSHELFRCKVCLFRSQHRYCSKEYPKTESYGVCNWCLSPMDDKPVRAQNSLNSDRIQSFHNDPDDINGKEKRGISKIQNHGRIKKQRLPAPAIERKTVAINSKSEEISNQVFRNKVRKYKFLNEVSSL